MTDDELREMADNCVSRRLDEGVRIHYREDILEALRQVRDQVTAEKDAELLIARRLLHSAHCPGGYADDGELQSNWPDCMIDFRRDPMSEIEAKIVAHGMLKYAEEKETEQRGRREIADSWK